MQQSSIYPASWYPLCETSEVPFGFIKHIQAFDNELVLFRDTSGLVKAIAARCPHMGANLARGHVVDGCIECPLHHWQFDGAGRCRQISGVNDIPAHIDLPALHCEEHYGVIWGFLGGTPRFAFPNMRDADRWFTRAHILDFDIPYQIFIANPFDTQHFVTVHHRELIGAPETVSEDPYHHGLKFSAIVRGRELHDRLLRAMGVRTVMLEGHCWGGSILFGYNARTNMRTLLSILPITAQHTRVFMISVLAQQTAPRFPQFVRRFILSVSHLLTLAFLKNDVAVMRDLQFKIGTLLPELDRHYIQWLQYWRRLPKVSFTEKP